MANKIQLLIPEPCHENWKEMTPVDKGRYCLACQKSVIDFTKMSDREIAQFFKKPSTGSVCGRFLDDQLGRDFEVPRKRVPWLRYFFQIAIPAFLASSKATAQGNVKLKADLSCSTTQLPIDSTASIKLLPLQGRVGGVQAIFSKKSQAIVVGKVVDEKGAVISGASITRKGTHSGTVSDGNGQFKIVIPESGKTEVLVISYVGYVPTESVIATSQKDLVVVLQPQPEKIVVITAGMVIRKPSKKKTIPLIPQRLMDTAYKFFKVFPNPVTPGAELTIEWKQTTEGYYHLQLTDLTGKLIHQREIWIDADAKWLNLDVPSVLPGTYVLQVVSKKNGKSHSEKVIVQ